MTHCKEAPRVYLRLTTLLVEAEGQARKWVVRVEQR